ncbi:hypothetical protein QZM15_33050 [Burkholderia sp. AU44665]|uniref:hypothetical protein n=1 Tax=Burkholderia sp. AU44665 TaxID=3059203 RepID=UPI00265FFF61|nr:hypothetical protein [Burkholderia sp. AU44665]MDN7703314.1 hypothetical protein [Burkholderia sp. AU44665]
MTDKEMLELAAKAANQERSFAGDLWSSARGCLWDPLGNDGDAIRLAMRLKLDIKHLDNGIVAENLKMQSRPYAVESYGENPLSAVRRAIVRAAAEIGKRGS